MRTSEDVMLMPIRLARLYVGILLLTIAGTWGLIEAMRPAPIAAAATAAGPQAQSSEKGAQIVPFKINVPDAVLTDLKERLARVRFPDEIAGSAWDYGTNLAYLKELVVYWRDKFDWRAEERRLNQFEQFKTNIDGLDIHFIHQRSRSPNAIPLLLLNGWPGTIDEFTKVIGPLTDPVAHGGRPEDAFHVVVPSMPGYGFSDKPRERGYNSDRMAGIWAKLMARLGYAGYGTHGTDWGAGTGARLAVNDAAHVLGLHLTGCAGGGPPPPNGRGYSEIQGTKPQTVGFGLSDSPVGLAAWIVEKYHGWSDDNGEVEKVYTKDQLLTTITIYWVTNSATSSARLYYENRHPDGRFLPTAGGGGFASRVEVPTGCGNFTTRYDFRGDFVPTPRTAAEKQYNVVRWTDMPRGGHFPALEQPQLWVDDVRAFFRDRR